MFNARNPPSTTLREIKVLVQDRKECLQNFNTVHSVKRGDSGEFWRKFFCGGSKDPKDGTACYHDSGSPLLCTDKYGREQLHGVAVGIHGPEILNKPCKPGSQMVFFTRVATYAKWIMETIISN